MLVVIGPRWLDLLSDRGVGTATAPDFVVSEIEKAFAQRVPVIPVLVDGAGPVQAVDLPENVVDLAALNAARIHAETFSRDADDLVQRIRELVGWAPAQKLMTPATWTHGETLG